MAAVSAYAEWPDRVRATFINTKKNACGIYGIIVHINGVKSVCIVDDFFLHNDDGHAAFAAFKRGKFWVSILEKVWAKLLGSYERCWAGNEGDPLNVWTGKPNRMIYHRDVDTDMVFDWLMRCDKAEYANGAASKPAATNDVEMENGIVYGHGFAILSVHKVELDGQEMRFVKLRNPWGRGEWNGAWGDKSDLWTDEAKEKLGWTDADDGSFFMVWSDYLEHFCTSST
jgi:hypothetical protein